MPKEEKQEEPKTPTLIGLYSRYYKQLLIIPFVILLISMGIIGASYLRTGEFFNKDVSLKGGATVTVIKEGMDINELQSALSQEFDDVNVRLLSETGKQKGAIIDAGIAENEVGGLLAGIEQKTGVPRSEDTVQFIGSALGASFFSEAMMAVLIAFALMGLTVFAYFRFLAGVKTAVIIPSLFTIWAAFNDIICTFAVLVLFDVKLSTAGLAAFLMLIGYSIDTDILLTTRVLKGKEGSILSRTLGAAKTGITLSLTSFVAVFAGYIFSQSITIKQIMLVLWIGLLFDILHTWITNAGMLRWYLERKKTQNE